MKEDKNTGWVGEVKTCSGGMLERVVKPEWESRSPGTASMRRPPVWVGTVKCHVLGLGIKWDLELGAE